LYGSPADVNSCKKDDAASDEKDLLLSSVDTSTAIFDEPKRKCVFDGTELEQKFTRSANFEKRFVWINVNNRSIHMSEHFTKERRHKEASLADVTDVVMGSPTKAAVKGGGENPDLGMTIVFKRGGGIDLHFSTKEMRDIWHETVAALIADNARPN
jgi:hypothetical protein